MRALLLPGHQKIHVLLRACDRPVAQGLWLMPCAGVPRAGDCRVPPVQRVVRGHLGIAWNVNLYSVRKSLTQNCAEHERAARGPLEQDAALVAVEGLDHLHEASRWCRGLALKPWHEDRPASDSPQA